MIKINFDKETSLKGDLKIEAVLTGVCNLPLVGKIDAIISQLVIIKSYLNDCNSQKVNIRFEVKL